MSAARYPISRRDVDAECFAACPTCILRRIRVTRKYDEAEKVSMSAADAWRYVCESDLKNFGLHDDLQQSNGVTY